MRQLAFGFRPGMDPIYNNGEEGAGEDGDGEEDAEVDDLSEPWTRRLRFDGGDGPGGAGPGAGLVV